MKIETPDNSFKNIQFEDSSDFNLLADHIKETASSEKHHLSLFLGLYQPDKQKALKKLSAATGRSVEEVDFNELVSKSESETFENFDKFFNSYNRSESILHFRNGGKLCGAYTGFTHSRIKYATPQERYFIKKVQEFQGLVIVDISEYTDADKTIRRAAQSIVKFVLPRSPLKRFMWHLKNYTLHGYQLKTKRPESYGEDYKIG